MKKKAQTTQGYVFWAISKFVIISSFFLILIDNLGPLPLERPPHHLVTTSCLQTQCDGHMIVTQTDAGGGRGSEGGS